MKKSARGTPIFSTTSRRTSEPGRLRHQFGRGLHVAVAPIGRGIVRHYDFLHWLGMPQQRI